MRTTATAIATRTAPRTSQRVRLQPARPCCSRYVLMPLTTNGATQSDSTSAYPLRLFYTGRRCRLRRRRLTSARIKAQPFESIMARAAGRLSNGRTAMGGTGLEPVTPSLSNWQPDLLLFAIVGAFSTICRRFHSRRGTALALVCTRSRTLVVARGSTVHGSGSRALKVEAARARARSRRRECSESGPG